jgi:hypothetical protein
MSGRRSQRAGWTSNGMCGAEAPQPCPVASPGPRTQNQVLGNRGRGRLPRGDEAAPSEAPERLLHGTLGEPRVARDLLQTRGDGASAS